MAKKRKKTACAPCGLNPMAFGKACGFLCALGIFVLALLAMFTGYGTEFVALISTVYIGFKLTFVGAIIGAVWGFIDGFIGGYLFAWIYNKCLKCY